MQFRIKYEGAGQDPDPTISRDTAKFWRDKHRVELQTKPDWRLQDLFDDIDDMLSIEASPTDANGRPQPSGEHLKRMLLPDLIRIEVEVAEATYRDRRSLEDYLRALPQYEQRIRQVFAELDSEREKRSGRNTESDFEPVVPDVWKPGEWKGCYRLEKQLGEGGFGEVWKAEGDEGALVAIKTIRLKDREGHPEKIEALDKSAVFLEEEARVLRALSGHNLRVPKYVDWAKHNQRPYLVMQYIEGTNLEIARGLEGDWGWRRCVRIILSLLETVSELNRLSYYNYDIKPPNVMLDEEDRAWVIDLGSAQSWEEMCRRVLDPTRPTTRHYAPPELAFGDKIFTAQTGIYLVGGVLYFLLTKKPPHPRNRQALELFSLHAGRPQPPGEVYIGLPDWLDDLCLQMLDPKQENRPKNATVVIEALKRGLAETPSTPAALLDTGRPEVLPDSTAPAAGSRHVVPRLAGWRLTSLVSLLVASALLGLGALSLRGDAEEPPFRLCALEDRVPVPTPGWVFQDPPRVWRDGDWVKHQGSWPTLIRLGHIKSFAGAFETKLDLHVAGKVNAIGLGHSLETVPGEGSRLPRAEFQLVCLRPGTVSEPPDHYTYRYAKFQITNPDPTQAVPEFLRLPGHLEQLTLDDLAPIPAVPFLIRAEVPNLTLKLKVVNNYLTEVDINGAAFVIDDAAKKCPKFLGDVYLLIDSYISPTTTRADWVSVSTGSVQTQLLP